MKDLVLWGLVGVAVLMSFTIIILQLGKTPEMDDHLKKIVRTRGTVERKAAGAFILFGFFNLALWTTFAFVESDVRYALVSWLPFASGWLAKGIGKAKEKEQPAEPQVNARYL